MDLGHQLTDEELAKLERRIKKAYKLANDEIEQYFAELEEKSKAQKAKFENGEITEQEYKRWRLNEATKGKHYKAIQKSIADQMNNADKIAVDYINGTTPDIYALNRNYAAYSIEQADLSASFDLVDGSTVKRLIEEDPKLLPNYPPKKAIDFAENSKYFQKQVTKQVTTGILLGESNEDIALRLKKNIPDMGMTSAYRNARTATTSAECAGRQDTYMAAKNMGIVLKKEWQATSHSKPTRDAHIAADGQKVEVEQPFIVGGERLMNPGDPSGSAWNIMNCRCTTVADVNVKESAKNKNPVSYNRWVEQKEQEQISKWQKQPKEQPTKYYTAEALKNMSRDRLIKIAEPLFVKENVATGLTEIEAQKRFNLLIGGNTTPQIRKYITKHQKR